MEIVFMDDWNYRMVKDNDKYIFYFDICNLFSIFAVQKNEW